MGRPKKVQQLPTRLEGVSAQIQEAALMPHAVNFQNPLYDEFRARELATIRGCTVSDIVRLALGHELDTDQNADIIHTLALQRLEANVAHANLRQALLPQPDQVALTDGF